MFLLTTCPKCSITTRVGSPSHTHIIESTNKPPQSITPGIICPSCFTAYLWQDGRPKTSLNGHTAKIPSPQLNDPRDPLAGYATQPPNLNAYTDTQLQRVLKELNLSTRGNRKELIERLTPHVIPT